MEITELALHIRTFHADTRLSGGQGNSKMQYYYRKASKTQGCINEAADEMFDRGESAILPTMEISTSFLLYYDSAILQVSLRLITTTSSRYKYIVHRTRTELLRFQLSHSW